MPPLSDFQQIAAMGDNVPDYSTGAELRNALGHALQGTPYGPQPVASLGQGAVTDPAINALGRLREFQAQNVAAGQASAADFVPEKITRTVDPKTGGTKYSIETTGEHVDAVMNALNFQKEALGGMQQQLQRLSVQEEAARNQAPWLQLATALSANLAQAKDMPGFVQGLGKTAAQLNPQADDILAQRVALAQHMAPVAEGAAKLQLAQQQIIHGKEQDQAIKREIEVDKVAQRFAAKLRLVAKEAGGTLTNEEIQAALKVADSRGVLPPEIVDAAIIDMGGMARIAIAGKEGEVERRGQLMTKAADLARANGEALENLRFGHRVKYMQEAFKQSHGQERLDFEKALAEVRGQWTVKIGQMKSLGVLTPTDAAKLDSGLSTNIYLGGLTDALTSDPETAKLAEPLFLVDRADDGTVKDVRFNKEAALPRAWQTMPKVKLDNLINHEIPRLLGLLFKQGAGAILFRSKEGLKILQSLGISNTMRVDQMLAVIENIRDTNNLTNFAPVRTRKPLIDWSDPDNGAMLGMNDPANAKFWSGVGASGGKIPLYKPVDTTKTGATSGTISKDDYDEWLKKQPGAR